ncbi:MAG: glycosyltransferase family 2 protein [Treponema sp.]|nr:glycosyltransferase family 2 protein [Treponema sp.]
MLLTISVCIPVYNTEPFLLQCLRSVITQEYAELEIVIVSDASRGKDEQGRTAKKIVHLAQKECNAFRKSKNLPKLKIKFVEHHENRGILEVRRTLCYEAHGEYICFVDSDDEMEQGALCGFFDRNRDPADIIQGKTSSGTFDDNGSFIPSQKNRFASITIGQLTGHQIFHEWVTNGNISGMLWGKLIKRELLVKAFDNIPYSECNFAEDYLISFFITQFARYYTGIDNNVYRYRITSGVSSTRKIDTLHKWEMICSTASVFTVISQWLKQNQSQTQITNEEVDYIRRRTTIYLANNLTQMNQTVIPELQTAARQLLCEYWGEHFVQSVEEGVLGALREPQGPQ